MAVVTLYQLVILHSGDEEWADEVETALRNECTKVIRHDQPIVRLDSVEEAAGTDAPTLVVCLGSEDIASSAPISHQLAQAREKAFAVAPLRRPYQDFRASFPEVIYALNAVEWGPGDQPSLQLLRLLGIIEQERKLFLSYRQNEASALAIQLHRALCERNYDVFLDRFSVPPGADFQRRIDAELTDKAFVLLAESESAVGSEWVQHEVSYALSHQIAVLALVLPGVATQNQYPSIDDAFRLFFEIDEIDGSGAQRKLTDDALQKTLDSIEWRYAREVRRRREQLLGSANDFLRQAGHDRTPLDGWGLLGRKKDQYLAVLVSPSSPRPSDLRAADLLRVKIEQEYGDENSLGAYLVHYADDEDPDVFDLARWIISGRPISIVHLEELLDVARKAA